MRWSIRENENIPRNSWVPQVEAMVFRTVSHHWEDWSSSASTWVTTRIIEYSQCVSCISSEKVVREPELILQQPLEDVNRNITAQSKPVEVSEIKTWMSKGKRPRWSVYVGKEMESARRLGSQSHIWDRLTQGCFRVLWYQWMLTWIRGRIHV